MKIVAKVLPIFILVALSSCYEKEIYSDIPKIEFEDLIFKDAATGFDTLILSFRFENGGNDFGIDPDQDIFPPYNTFNFFIDDNDSVITVDNFSDITFPIYEVPVVLRNLIVTDITSTNVFFSESGDSYAMLGYARDTIHSMDQLPLPECPNITNQDHSFDSINFKLYDIVGNTLSTKDVEVKGGLLVRRVETNFNLLIHFEENVGGNFEPLTYQDKFNTDNCEVGLFNVFVPFFTDDAESGTIKYKIKSTGFKSAFLDNEIRIKFQIIDRKLNRSNEVSYDFFLAEITQ